tara:strand:- start:3379 stop:4044 length:666 start_codon:yes stop_codon:yes gene_type:complete
MSGFIAIHRTALDHPVIGEPARFYAWFWIVSHACWKPTRVKIRGKVVTLNRGELSFSVRFMGEAWGWSKSRVDRFLSDLRQEGMIETRSKIGTSANHPAGRGQAVIKVCNYDKYQDPQARKRDKREPSSGTTAGQQRDKEEQGNKLSSLSNDNEAGDFWNFAVAYLGEAKRPMIGRWCKHYGGQAPVAQAITQAQFANAVDPIAYIERTLRGTGAEYESPC